MELKEVLETQEACMLEPLGHAVLVKPYERKRSGMIVLTEQGKKEMDIAENRAVVIRSGELAWEDEGFIRTTGMWFWKKTEFVPRPRANLGDHVLMTKFAGAMATGEDGQNYRIVNDQDIYCRLSGGAQ